VNDMHQIESEVRNYYGRELKSSADLKTNACCTVVAYPPVIKKALGRVHEEVLARYYGCGVQIPWREGPDDGDSADGGAGACC